MIPIQHGRKRSGVLLLGYLDPSCCCPRNKIKSNYLRKDGIVKMMEDDVDGTKASTRHVNPNTVYTVKERREHCRRQKEVMVI